MVLISAEPVMFLYMYCYSGFILLGQKLILERLCLEEMGNRDCSDPYSNSTSSLHEESHVSFLENSFRGVLAMTSPSTSPTEETVRGRAAELYMVITGTFALTSVASSQILGYWMDRMSRKTLMCGPVAGGILWSMIYILVAYFDNIPIYVVFVGVCFGGSTGGLVTLKATVTSYIVQETPMERRTVRLSAIEAAVFLGAACGILSMYLVTTYLTQDYVYMFLGVEGGHILSAIYIAFVLRNDLVMEYPQLRYSYDDIDGPPRDQKRTKSIRSYGSMGTTSSTSQRYFVAPEIFFPPEADNKGAQSLDDSEDELPAGAGTPPAIEVESCSASGASYFKGDSPRTLLKEIAPSNSILRPSSHSLAVPFSAAKALSVNSIYGTPPDLMVTACGVPSANINDIPATGVHVSSDEFLDVGLKEAKSINTISVYGTPPNDNTNNDYLGDQRNDRNVNDNVYQYEDTSMGLILPFPMDEINAKSQESPHLEPGIPSLAASTITIQSQVELRNPGKAYLRTLRSRKRELFLSECGASDSALEVTADIRRGALSSMSVSKSIEVRSHIQRLWRKSVSTPDSLNYFTFLESGYTNYSSSGDDQNSHQGYDQDNPDLASGGDIVDGGKEENCCSVIVTRMSDSITTTFRRREKGLRAMIIADVIANFFVSFVSVAETDNTYLYLSTKLNWNFSQFTSYFAAKAAVDGVALLLFLPLIRRFLGLKDATLGFLGGISRSAFFILLGLIQYSSQIYSVPIVGFFGQYLFVAERAIITSLVNEDEQGRVFTVLCSVDQMALLCGALFFDNLLSYFISKDMPGVTLLLAGVTTLLPTVIFGALYFSINSLQRSSTDEDDEDDEDEDEEASQGPSSLAFYGGDFDVGTSFA